MRQLYLTYFEAHQALVRSGKEAELSSADDRCGLDIGDGFDPDFSWSGEVQAFRTDDGDIFAWWEDCVAENGNMLVEQ